MSTITPSMIKELRERTGVGMAKCKQALSEAAGDMELAISNLRKAGIAGAVKKEGRESKEGLIGVAETDNLVALIELSAETDFVLQNDRFKEYLKEMAEEVAMRNPSSVEEFGAMKYSKDDSLTIDENRAIQVQAIGENIQIKRIQTYPKNDNLSIGAYQHLGGKLVTVVFIEGTSSVASLAKGIAMHVAASSPDYVSPEEVPSETVEKEKDIARTQLKGKPENIMDKIIEGKINAYYDDICLLRQKYIRNDKISVGEFLEEEGKAAGTPLKLTKFVRWNVGQNN